MCGVLNLKIFFEVVASVILIDGRRTLVERLVPAVDLSEARTQMVKLCLREESVDVVMYVK